MRAVRVTLPAAVRAAIVRHARLTAPEECCGFLVGRGHRPQFAVPVANVASQRRTRYRVSDQDHVALRRWLRRFEPPLEIVGVYHSHPRGPGTPSPRDIAEAHYPDWLWIIAAGPRWRIAAFRLIARGPRGSRYHRPFSRPSRPPG